MADLSIRWAGLTLKNPLVLAAGPLSDGVESCKAAAEAGFAAISLKSIAYRELPFRYQQSCPRFKVVDKLNQMERWTPDKGFERMLVIPWGEGGSVWLEDEYGEFINKVKRAVGKDVLVGASVIANPAYLETYDEYFEIFKQSDADYVEIDVGHPWECRTPEGIIGAIKKAKQTLSMPIAVKMWPAWTFPIDVAKSWQEAGADNIIMFDMGWGLDFDIDTLEFPFYDGTYCCDYSGSPLPYVYRNIAQARRAGVTTGLTASWGISGWKDMTKAIMCGADMVQALRFFMVRGYGEATSWLKSVNDWLDKQNYASIHEVRGKILDRIKRPFVGEDALRREEPPERGGIPSKVCVLDQTRCMGCTNLCVPACFSFALQRANNNNKVSVDKDKCRGCGLCEGICPNLALSLQART